MHYSTRIEDYLEAINGCEAFYVAKREHFQVINYLNMGTDTFPDIASAPDEHTARLWGLRRQCRGLAFDYSGNVISLPFQKFFNSLEKPETQLDRIDLSLPHVILEKLDGSMIRPIPVGDSYIIATKMGETEVSLQANEWMKDKPNYHAFIRHCLANNLTPIWEWCSVKNRVVIYHPVDRMVLIAVRNIKTGEYIGMRGLRDYCSEYDMELVKSYSGNANTMQSLMSETHDLLNAEGWVIRFDSGRMIKIKAKDYVIKHSAKDSLSFEKNVVEMFLLDKADDIKPLLDGGDRTRFENFETNFWNGVNETAKSWEKSNYEIRQIVGDDRKKFALEFSATIDNNLRGAIFTAWDKNGGFNWRNAVIGVIAKNIGTQTKVDSVRHLFGGVKWNYQSNVED